MKATVAPYATRAICLRIVCSNGTTIRLTQYPFDLVMSNAQIYLTASGYDFSGYVSGTSMAPASFDFEGIVGLAGFDRAAIAAGLFDGARCYLFACDFLSPVEDYEEITASILGRAELVDDTYRIEEMSLVDALNQSVGRLFSASCQKVFGGQEFAGCKKALGPLTVTGALTSVSSATQFTDSSRAEASGYYILGAIKFTSGQNAEFKKMEIKAFASGAFTTFEPFPYLPVIGDTYTLHPGCNKSREQCRDKWANMANFGGFPDMPTASIYASRGLK